MTIWPLPALRGWVKWWVQRIVRLLFYAASNRIFCTSERSADLLATHKS